MSTTMSTVRTPASSFSAYDRRRHILQRTPSTRMTGTTTGETSTRQPPQRTIWRSRSHGGLPSVFTKLGPYLSFTETTILQSVLLTFFTILLTILPTPLITLPARLLNRCNATIPRPTHPLTSILMRVLTFPFITLSLITTQLLLTTPDTMQAVGTTFTAIFQTTLQNFLIHGSTPPYQYLQTACVPSHSKIFPTWPDLLPQILHALLAAPLYHLLSRHAAAPPSSLPNRSRRRSIALPIIPTVLAFLPVSLIPLCTLMIAGYEPFLRSFGAVNLAFVNTLATLISWSIQTALQRSNATVSSPEVERDRIADLLRENAPSTLVLPSFKAITTSNTALHHFPGYTDASGTAWRTILAHCLHPLSTIRAALQNRPTPTLFASSTPVWRIVLPHEEVSNAITACAALASVYEECVQADTFGVVHRTLPYALGELLRCKVETAGFVADGVVEWGERLRKSVGVCSGRDMVVAVDDALSVCVYRIVGAFKPHLETYIKGAEVEWDRGLNGLLEAFLEYQVP